MYQYDMGLSLETLIKDKNWKKALASEFEQKYFLQLQNFLDTQYKKKKIIYPPQDLIFHALNIMDPGQVKVVILGQDPYHGEKEAHGLSFSVSENIKIPPSLRNIFKELESDLLIKPTESGNLESWAQQGVLLLNSILTVEKDKAGSHQQQGWEEFTDQVISIVSEKCDHVVFILWGAYAQKKIKLIDEKKHLIISGVHPSPLSSYRGFFGSKPFSKSNAWLVQNRLKPIDWSLDSDLK
jgi:uracil-DNA glycosylase